MNYDKNSFLAGISVGRTLKGWSGGATITDDDPPQDGKTRFYVTIPGSFSEKLSPPGNPVTVNFSQTVSNGVVINWGDGSAEETVSRTSGSRYPWVSATHNYAFSGEYAISLTPLSDCTLKFGDSGEPYAFDPIAPLSLLRKAYIGKNVTVLSGWSFATCYSLEKVVLQEPLLIGDSAFRDCTSLKEISLPQITSFPHSFLQDCHALQSLTIPNTVQRVESSALMDLSSNRILVFPESVNYLGNKAFAGAAYTEAHFLSKVPPETTHATFYAVGSRIFYVPKGSLDAYKSAPNWSDYADNIMEEP